MIKPNVETIPQLPAGCGYEGHDFGASYPDSKCFGGRLYDLDNCDNHGNLYEPSDYIPCPQCQLMPNMPPNHHGKVAEIWSDGQILVEFPLSGENHSQVAPYPRSMVRKRSI